MRKYFNFFFLLIILTTSIRCRQTNTSELTMPEKQYNLYAFRSGQLSNIGYYLYFDLPNAGSVVTGNVVLSFFLQNSQQAVILDFKNAKQRLKSIQHNEKDVPYRIEYDHIVIEGSNFDAGENQLEISFLVDSSDNLLMTYQSFASALTPGGSDLFPCFEQPDLRASFLLNLQTPSTWNSASVADVLRARNSDNRQSVAFARSRIISPTAFRFVSGHFDTLSWQNDVGNNIRIFLPKNITPEISEKAVSFAALQQDLLEQTSSFLQLSIPFDKTTIIFTNDNPERVASYPGLLIYPVKLLVDSSLLSQNGLQLVAKQSVKQWISGLVSFVGDRDNLFEDALVEKITDKVLVFSQHAIDYESANKKEDSVKTEKNRACQQLELISVTMGDSLFAQGLTSFFTTYSWGSANEEDFVREMELIGNQPKQK